MIYGARQESDKVINACKDAPFFWVRQHSIRLRKTGVHLAHGSLPQ